MTIVPPEPGEPRRPQGPRDPGDAWVVADDGTKYWGRFGAAGLVAIDDDRGVLLQQRVSWSHHGGTWGVPGGALHEGESALDGAIREATEEAGIPPGSVRPLFTHLLDLDIWCYTSVVARVVTPFEPEITDPESVALAWVPFDEVESLPLHPGFAASWPALRADSAIRPVVIVDAANVVGSVPDGWWKDRVGANTRLMQRVADLASRGLAASDLDLPQHHWYPPFTVVVEGQAKRADDVPGIDVVRAPGEGDDAIVDVATRAVAEGKRAYVVTSDRGLRDRVTAAGAHLRSSGWLLDRLP